MVEDSAVWSSPISASTPPCFEVPAKLAWRNTSPRAVDARALAVPDAEHAVVLALAAQLGLLRAPQRGGGEVLVEAGLEHDVVRREHAARALELLVEPAERRAAIAGDVAGGIEAGAAVALLLHQA